MFSDKTLTDLDISLLKEKYPKNYEKYIKKIKNGYPIQYILGNVDFFNVNILVNRNVLIPRFETEYLVEKVLKRIEKYKEENLKVIDICTGSGCIAIAIAKNTNFSCLGIDISKKALKIAKKNSIKNNVKINYKKLNILKDTLEDNYDIIISNPPYIAKNEAVDNSTRFEPQIALFAEENGLLFYRKIIEQIKNTPKLIAFEIGENESNEIKKIISQKFPNAKISVEKDLVNKDRYIFVEC